MPIPSTQAAFEDSFGAATQHLGTAALTRPTVQEALRQRAEQAGHGAVGAENATVGRVIREVLDERRQVRAAAYEADVAQAASGEVPQCVADLVTRFDEGLRTMICGIVAEVQRRAETEAQARVTAAESAAAARVAEIMGELESRSQEADALAADHERATAELDERTSEVAALTAALEERTATIAAREAEAARRMAELEAELKTAHGERREADARAHAAEVAQSRLEATVARLEERVAASEHARDEWHRTAERHEARAREAERVAEERRVRLELVGAGNGRAHRKAPRAGVAGPTEERASAPQSAEDTTDG
jgi:hypothetical protein